MEKLTDAEINRKIMIWNRMHNDPETMMVAKGLVEEVLEKLYELKKKQNQ